MGSVGSTNNNTITPEIAKSYIQEINKTRLSYKGQDSEYNYRVAEISFDDDIAGGNGIDRVVDEIENLFGYEIDRVSNGLYLLEVDNRDDYRLFSSDFQKIKKKVRDELKKIK